MNKINLYELGLNEEYIKKAKEYGEGFYTGRVSLQHGFLYKVITEEGEILAEVSGKLDHISRDTHSYPTVGDWVLIDRINNNNGNGIIHHILPRQSSFIRKTAGLRTYHQVVAANIDVVFICMSLNNDFNIRRLERYLSVAWDSNALPVILLTKADICNDLGYKLMEATNAAIGVEVLATTITSEDTIHSIAKYVTKGKTAAFIGSSGVGKSSIINKLLGNEILKTKDIGYEDKGRHTTTSRQLFMIPTGGVVIDTPGMRELGILSADMEKTFSDIEELSHKCKFSDCRHENEPGCAVKDAIENGLLDISRLENFKKLQRELKYNGLNSRELEKEKINEMFGGMAAMKEAKKHVKNKNKRR